MKCQVCSKDLTTMAVEQRQAHYDMHFTDETIASSAGPSSQIQDQSKRTSPRTLKINRKDQESPGPNSDKKNVFWFPHQMTRPPPNFSPGLVPIIKKALIRMHERGHMQRAWLCHDLAVHVSSEGWDRGWGCGYRNCLMACASLMAQQKEPLYFPLLDGPPPPGVRNVQSWIESAWENGYDEEGAVQLKHTLVDTSKWIGTGELYTAFTFRRIPSQLVDFQLTRGVDTLIEWILDYFSSPSSQMQKGNNVDDILRGASPVIVTDKLPIILQHSGHSRTVVGVEKTKSGALNLLVFDPSKRIPSSIRDAGLGASNAHRSPTQLDHQGRLLQPLLHPIRTLKSHKRKQGDGTSGSPKRLRLDEQSGAFEHPIIIDDGDNPDDAVGTNHDAPPREDAPELDPKQVLNLFRVATKTLGRKNKYQILYFPLEQPLDDQQRTSRKVVTSLKIS